MKIWNQNNNKFHVIDITSTISSIPSYVYHLKFDLNKGDFYLEHQKDSFDVPQKVYGDVQPFVNRVVKSWNASKKNLGVLLSGLQGTGKTLAANLICNNANLPTIVISSDFSEYGMREFIASLTQDVIIYIDEYDKIFEKSHTLLSLMDGVFNSKYRKLFLLTKNEGFVSDYMLNRPSRIRYFKEYGNLEEETVRDIVNDHLINSRYKEELVSILSKLEILSFDTIYELIKEMNLHEISPKEAMKDFNIYESTNFFTVNEYDLENNLIATYQKSKITNVETSNVQYSNLSVGNYFYLTCEEASYDEKYLGMVTKIENNRITVEYGDVQKLYVAIPYQRTFGF